MTHVSAANAYLSHSGQYTSFTCGKHTIRFRTPDSLERYTAVKECDKGYLVVMAKYRHHPEPEEEYIDLVPILNDLYFDSASFLAPIERVSIRYDS